METFMGEFDQPLSKHVRVLVVDASRMSGQLIASALKRCRNNFDVYALTCDSSMAFHELVNYRPHVAVISTRLKDGPFAGFKVLYQLRASKSKVPVVALLDSPERELVVDAFRAGARGIFCRDCPFNALPKCISRVYEGQIWVSNSELEFLIELVANLRPFRVQDTGGMARLTPRERDIVRLVAEGMRNQDISRELNIREHTVRNYVFRVFNKLGISSRVELVLYSLSGADSSGAQASHDLAEDQPSRSQGRLGRE